MKLNDHCQRDASQDVKNEVEGFKRKSSYDQTLCG